MAAATSSQSSGVTGSDPSDFVDHEEVSNMDLSGKEPTSSEWTDEKHSMYLKSMEASFIDQLYSSLDLGGQYTQKKHHSHMKSYNATESQTPYEFKVHRNGCWQRIKFNRGEPPPQDAEECRVLKGNPWIQHFRVGVRENATPQGNTSIGSQNVSYGGRMALTCGLATQSRVSQAPQDSNGDEEFTDQNFDEDNEQEEGTGSLHLMKRKNTVEAAPSKDQVKRRIGI